MTAYNVADNLDTLLYSNDPREQLAAGVSIAMTAFGWYAARLGSTASKSGGRLGVESTRTQLSVISEYLKSRGWNKIGGRPEFPEEYLPPKAGAPKGNFVDATFEKNGKVLRIQTVTTKANGDLTIDEANAANSIRFKRPNDHLLTPPKEPQ